MTPDLSDQELDHELRGVPLPPLLLQRLQAAVADEQLDEQLRSVEMPAGFLDRLAANLADATLAEPLGEIRVPSIRVPRGPRRRSRFPRRWATPATLMLVLTAAQLSAIWALVLHIAHVSAPPPALVFLDTGPLEFQVDAFDAVVIGLEEQPSAVPRERNLLAVHALTVQPPGDVLGPRPAPPRVTTAHSPQPWDLLDSAAPHLSPLWLTVPRDSLALRLPPRRALQWPPRSGHSRLFHSGNAAPIEPSGTTGSVRVPMSTSTASFEEALVRAQDGRWPRPERIRSEDFVAAVASTAPSWSASEQPLPSPVSAEWAFARAPFPYQSHTFLHLTLRGEGRPAGEALAENLQVELQFFPAAVAAFRIVGYGPPDTDALLIPRQGDPLRAGQHASVLAEVWLRSEAAGTVATATIMFDDPTTGQQQLLPPLAVDLEALVGQFGDADLGLQAAVVAAETAALLSGEARPQWPPAPAFAEFERPTRVDDLLSLAQRGPVHADHREGWRRLVTLLQQLDALR